MKELIITHSPFLNGLPRHFVPRNDGCAPCHCKPEAQQSSASKYSRTQGFSLIELLISLIIISLIISLFVPILTGKLKHQNATLSSGTANCKKFGSSCLICSKTKCSFCENACPLGEYIHTADNCSCKKCDEKFQNCTKCTLDYCESCQNGYKLENGLCKEITCPTGAYKFNNECLPCTNNCLICDSAFSCQKCQEGYHLEENTCKKDAQELPPSEENCALVNAMYIKAAYNGVGGKDLCASKFNAGDPNGLPLLDDIEIRQARASSSDTLSKDAKTCWQGATTYKCGFSPTASTYGFSYNSCTRTVCTFKAAQAICNKHGWRLPKYSELLGWNNNFTQITKYMGERGLQLCGHVNNWHPWCDHVDGCPGSHGYSCLPDMLWYENSPYNIAYLGNDILGFTSGQPHSAVSVRCVAESIKY